MISPGLLRSRGPRYYFLQLCVALKELSALWCYFVNHRSLVIPIGLFRQELAVKKKGKVLVKLIVAEVGAVHYVGLALPVAGNGKDVVDNL